MPLRVASNDLPFVAGAWVGLTMAPLAISAAWVGATWGLVTAMGRTVIDG
jgi:hypothetical protein